MKNKIITIRISEEEKKRIDDYRFLLGFDDNSKFILHCIKKEMLFQDKMNEAILLL